MTNCCPALAAHSDAEERFRQWKQRAKLGEAGSPALPFVLLLLLLSFFFFFYLSPLPFGRVRRFSEDVEPQKNRISD